jgi:stage IV sporulation protein FB
LVLIKFHPLSGIVLLFAILSGQAMTMVVLFAIALWHELGHYVAASFFRWRIREVLVFPFGGVLVVDEHTDVPIYQEIIVTLAGPMQHMYLMFVFYLLIQTQLIAQTVLMPYMQANVGLLLFNLLPVLPLDGGKILTAVGSRFFAYYKVLRFSYLWSMAVGIVGLLFLSLVCRAGGFAIQVFVMSSFIVYSNYSGFTHIPYLFRRFLLQPTSRNRKEKFIYTTNRMGIEAIVKQFMRGRKHVIIHRNQIWSEARLLYVYFKTKPIATTNKL